MTQVECWPWIVKSPLRSTIGSTRPSRDWSMFEAATALGLRVRHGSAAYDCWSARAASTDISADSPLARLVGFGTRRLDFLPCLAIKRVGTPYHFSISFRSEHAMCRRLLFVVLAGVSFAAVGCCQPCCPSYDYSTPVIGMPAASSCTNCVTTPTVTYQSQTPTPTLAPVR